MYRNRLLVFLLFFSAGAFAQSDYKVASISFEGLKKNKEDYLRLFIQSSVGGILDQRLIDEDLDLLNRRTGVAKSTVKLDTNALNQVNVVYKIQEQRTLIPQFGIGGIKGNFWWQLGLAEYNLGGRGQTILVTYLHNDGRPNGKLFYQNDWVKGTPWGFGGDLNHNASIEPLYFSDATVQFRYTNTGIGFFGSYNLDFNHRLLVGTNFFQEQYEKVEIDPNFPTPGPDELVQNKLLFKANLESNKLGYDYFYRTGMQWNLLGQAVATINESSPFLSLTFEGKNFWRPYSTGNFALRVRAALATNTPSPFAPFVLDSRVNIRGVGNRVDRGTAQFVVNLEFRQTVFHRDRFAAQVVAFADSGTWRNPGGELNDLFNKDLFRQFIGVGIRWIDKKVFRSVFRLDYGFDLWNINQNGPVLGVGQYF